MTVLIRPPMPASSATASASITQRSMSLSMQQALDAAGQVIPDLVRPVRRVEQERRAVLGGLEHLGLAEQPELVAGDEVGVLDEVGRADRLAARTAGARR